MILSPGPARASAGVLCVAAFCCLPAAGPAAASGAGTTSRTDRALGITIPVPASARVHGTTTPSTPQPATTTPASTTPASTTPAATTPTSGAQPGTVAPTTTPTTTTSTTPTPPTSTQSAGGVPTTTVHSTTVAVAHKPSRPPHLSTGALILAILGGLLALGCLVWAIGRWLALEPRWTVSLMHSLREVSYRGSATWAEFTDWVRLGR